MLRTANDWPRAANEMLQPATHCAYVRLERTSPSRGSAPSLTPRGATRYRGFN
jgi:hypothetical protein